LVMTLVSISMNFHKILSQNAFFKMYKMSNNKPFDMV
jgi:hypothetical protein